RRRLGVGPPEANLGRVVAGDDPALPGEDKFTGQMLTSDRNRNHSLQSGIGAGFEYSSTSRQRPQRFRYESKTVYSDGGRFSLTPIQKQRPMVNGRRALSE